MCGSYSLTITQPALEATNIILLFDPEHLTAANFRKRRIVKLYEQSPSNPGFETVVEREMLFITSILTSPLHRQSKSPILWNHRFWLMDFTFKHGLCASPLSERVLEYAKSMFDPVFRSADQHSKNYFAWQYARRMVHRLQLPLSGHSQAAWESWLDDFLTASAKIVRDWCFRHPSDISGWSYLIFLLPKLKTLGRRTGIVNDVFDYAIKVKAKQESLWAFIRTVLADDMLGPNRQIFMERLELIEHGQRTDQNKITDFQDLAIQAVHWINRYQRVDGKPRVPNP
jgi:hypothetical protein